MTELAFATSSPGSPQAGSRSRAESRDTSDRSVPSRARWLLRFTPEMGAGVGVAPTTTWLMRPVGSLDLPAMAEAHGFAPRSRGLQPRAITRSAWPPERMARTAGNAPASGRFGDGCLACRPRPYEQMWGPGPVARRLPLLGRQSCVSQHLPGKNGGASRSLSRLVASSPPSPWPGRGFFPSASRRQRLVELDGYAPSPPRCGRGVLLLAPQPRKLDARAGLAPA